MKLSAQFRHAVTVIVAFASLARFGCPALFDALAPVAVVSWQVDVTSLHALVSGFVVASVALCAPGVYRGLVAKDARDREMFLRSLSIAGQLPR